MSKRSLAILLALLLVARACLVLSLSDVFFYGEELGKGAAAKAMLDGLGVEHYKLSYGYHEGGGFVVTHLKALAFLLVGENVLAHKLVALFMTSVLLAVGLWFTSEHFGRAAGWIFGVLFVFCPASFQRFSLLDLGTHFEAMIFIVLILHFTFRIVFAKQAGDLESQSTARRKRLLDHIGLGLSAGFGAYFSLQCAPAIACAGVCLIAAERKRIFSRSTVFALAAFAVGALPLWLMMRHVGMAALIVRGHQLGEGTSVAESVREIFEPLLMYGSTWDWIVLATYAFVIGVGLAALWRGARSSTRSVSGAPKSRMVQSSSGETIDLVVVNRKALIVFGYVALFLFLYVASGLSVSVTGHWFFFLRLTALWFMSIVLIAAVSIPLFALGSSRVRAFYAGSFGLILLAGVVDFFAVISEGRPSEIASNVRIVTSTKGYNYSEYLDKFVHHFEATEEEKIAVMRHYRDEPELLFTSINHSLFEHSKLTLDDVLAICRRAYGDQWIDSLKGLGPYVFSSNSYNLDAELAAVARAPIETQQSLAEAVGRTGKGLKIEPDKIEKEIRAPVPATLRQSFLRGTGWRIHQLNRLHPERALEFIAHESAEDQVPLREGFDAAVAMNTLK